MVLAGFALVAAPRGAGAAPVALPTTMPQLFVAGATTDFGGDTFSQFSGFMNSYPASVGVAVDGVLSGTEPGLIFTGSGGNPLGLVQSGVNQTGVAWPQLEAAFQHVSQEETAMRGRLDRLTD